MKEKKVIVNQIKIFLFYYSICIILFNNISIKNSNIIILDSFENVNLTFIR